MVVLLIWISAFIVVGFCFALVARIRALRSHAVASRPIRILLIAVLGTYAFLAAFIVLSWFIAAFKSGELRMGYETWADWDMRRGNMGLEVEDDAQFSRQLHHEIWLQMLSFSVNCSSPDPRICELVARTRRSYISGSDSWQAAITIALLFSSISGLAAASFSWLFTRNPTKQKRAKSARARVES